MIDLNSVKSLVAEQIRLIADPARKTALTSLIVEPRVEERDWDYGRTGERYPYWVVAEDPSAGVILVYCDQGFGPEFPWGFLRADDEEPSLGMDSQWNWYLEEAFIRAGLWKGATFDGEPWHFPPDIRFSDSAK